MGLNGLLDCDGVLGSWRDLGLAGVLTVELGVEVDAASDDEGTECEPLAGVTGVENEVRIEEVSRIVGSGMAFVC